MAATARASLFRRSPGRMLGVLHAAFALTGVCHSIPGPLLPSLSSTFHLNDSRSGLLLTAYYAGTSLGALLCGRRPARTMTVGFMALTGACLAMAGANRLLVLPLYLLVGVCVGVPMTAVSMYAGTRFGPRGAAALTFLNFSWSAGALLAPLFAAQLLVTHTFRAAYVMLAVAAALAAMGCRLQLQDATEPSPAPSPGPGGAHLRLVALFALLTFLEVGVENTTGSWMGTYVLRTSGRGEALAAATSSIYWCGFLASRGLSSLLLLRVRAARLLGIAVAAGLLAALVLVSLPGTAAQMAAMVLLGASLAPVFPLLLASFFARARHASDSRWVLAICGFGGSVVPWLTGWISAQSGSLRLGLTTIPMALLIIGCLLPLIRMEKFR